MTDKKSELLGLNYSTASSSLRKQIIFHLAGQLELLVCFQCGEKIEDIAKFSIEHKDSWMRAEDPKAAFFDMNNIAFSHLSCNSGAGLRPNKVYADKQERGRAQWARHYAKNSVQVLERKRERYQRDVSQR